MERLRFIIPAMETGRITDAINNCTSLFRYIDLYLLILDPLGFNHLQGMAHFGFTHGYKREEVLHLNQSDIFFFQLAFIGEEAYNIYLVYLVFLTGCNK